MINDILRALLEEESISFILLKHLIGYCFVLLSINNLEIVILAHREEVMHKILSDLDTALGMLQCFLMLVELTQQCADLHVHLALVF